MIAALFRRFGSGAVLAALALAGLGFTTIAEDELWCEQAAAHLVECCPKLDASTIQCFHSGGCGEPDGMSFSLEESQCVVDLDCDAVRAKDLCEIAPDLSALHASQQGGEAGEVCP